MDEETIIRLAKEAGIYYRDDYEFCEIDRDGVPMEMMARFAALVAAAEREACALVAESYEPTCESCPSGVANAIRGRGKG
jgi:hypothetical protein